MPSFYFIKVDGHLDQQWSTWLNAVELHHLDDGATQLKIEVVDQAALYGVIAKLRNLGLTLLVVRPGDKQADQR